MFDTMNIAKRIKQARIDRNMTQMNLADAMGVSFQAVSNWERGNSMPDISKLADLCAALDITVNDLLGIDAPVVTKVIEKEELTVEELAEVARVLPPAEVKEKTEKAKKKKKLKLDKIADMAPFLDQEYLDELVMEAELNDLDGIDELAPFLTKETLDRIAVNAPIDELDELVEIRPCLSRETVDKLVGRCTDCKEF